MAVTSRLPLRAISALSMSAARWSGRTSASAPLTLPMGVRHASTTNTGLIIGPLWLAVLPPFASGPAGLLHHKTRRGGTGFPVPPRRVVNVLLTGLSDDCQVRVVTHQTGSAS